MVAERRFDGADSGYESHSGSFVETSEDLKAKAELQMAEACWIEGIASRNFQMRRQFWEDELKLNAQDLEATEHFLDEAQGQLTTDTEDLKMTEDDLAEDTAALEDTMRDCQAKAVEFETATNGQSGELDAYAKARAVISQKTGGAESVSHGLSQTSFLQLSRSVLSPSGGLTKFEAVWKTKELAKSEHSFHLAQLASRAASGVHAETVITHVQHVVHTAEVERLRIIEQTVQRPIIQEKINQVTKHDEVQLSQFTDKVVDVPVVVQRQIPIAVQTVQKAIESSQLQDIDEVVDVPVGLVAQVPLVRVVAETAEISQLACETCVKDNMFRIAGEINVAGKCHHETVLRGTVQNWNIVGSKWWNRGSKQQQQHQAQATRQQPRKEEEEEKGRGEREKGRKGQRGSGQEGRKEEEREAEEGGRKRVEKDVTGWTEVSRNKRKKMVQIFVKVDGGKTSAMEMEMNDKVDDIVKKIPIGDQDVYVTSGGRILRRSDKLKSCEVRDGSTVEVTSRMRGGGKHKDKKSKVEKQAASAKTPVQMDEARKWFEEHQEYLKILDCTSEETEEEVQQKVQNNLACMQKVSWMTKEEFVHLEKLVRQMVETRRNGMDEDQDQRRQAQQGQEQSKQGKQVRFGDEQQLGKTGAENASELEVMGRTTEVRTGRGSAGLARGGDERCQADETSRKGKGKGNGGKGEHDGKAGGAGSKGRRQVENLVMDEGQENMRTKTSAENHEEDMRKLLEMVEREEMELEMMQQEEMEHEEQRGRVAPNMGAGGSHPQATSDPRKKKKETRALRWADCNDEEGKENEEEVEEEKETEQREKTDERLPGLAEEVEQEERPSQGESEQEVQEEERRRAQEAREEERRVQEAKEERKAQKERMEQEREVRVQEERERVARETNAQEERERKVSAHEERREREREAEAQGGHESDAKAQEGHEGEVEEQGEDSNSLQEESHVSNRHMTWWHNAWWVRVNNGPHLRTARDRRRVWRAATKAAQEVRDTGKVAGGEREKREQGKTERIESNTLHVVFHFPTATTATTAAAAAAAAAVRLQ